MCAFHVRKWQGGYARNHPRRHDVTSCHDFNSLHLLSAGCIQVCLSCTRISDKVPGKLGGASAGDTKLLSKFPRHHVGRSRFRTSIQTLLIRILQQKHNFSEIARLHFQNLPVCRYFTPKFRRVIHDSCSPSSHVATKHWEKQTAPCRSQLFVGRWLLRNSDAVVCFCQPSSAELVLNAMKLPFVLCWGKQKNTPHRVTPTTYAHRHLSTRFHVTTQD